MKRQQIKRRPLADTVLSSLEPEDKEYRELDSPGLYFRVKPNGGKSWILRYKRASGKWAWLGLGAFPGLNGKAARKSAQDLQELAANGIDLRAHKDGKRKGKTFGQVAEDWYQRKIQANRAPNTLRTMRYYLDEVIKPELGDSPLEAVTRRDCAEIQSSLETDGSYEVAKKVRNYINQIFSLAIGQGLCELNPASELQHIARESPPVTHYPHLLEPELPAFLKALRAARSTVVVQTAIWLALRTASRPGMVRLAEWSEVDLDQALWRVPAAKMKTRKDHAIPLAPQTVQELRYLHQITGRSRYLFPGFHSRNPVLGHSTLNTALAGIGYKGKLVGHGCRHTASTLLREHGWAKDFVESQLAHAEQGVAGVYNKAQYLEQRRGMMQWYADYLDALEKRTEKPAEPVK